MASKYGAAHVSPKWPGDARPLEVRFCTQGPKNTVKHKATRSTSAKLIFTVNSMASKYAAAHVSPKGPGDARPTALQIIHDERLEGKLKDKTFLITGCSSGIGVETARAIADTGATVYCSVRDVEKGKNVLEDILVPGRVELLDMDLGSLQSVRTAAAEFLANTADKPINVLICNAGVMALPIVTTTVDGFETQFGTNHLGHFLLFNLLKPSLHAASTPQFNSRVVTVSSTGHRLSGIRYNDFGFKNGDYTPLGAYGQSKTANIYMANYIDRHFGHQGIHALSLHPGVVWTQVSKHLSEEQLEDFKKLSGFDDWTKSTEQGAATTVWAAVAEEWEGKGGKYLEDMQVSSPVKDGYVMIDPGYAKHAYDEEEEDRLWAESLKMVGLV